MTPVLALGAADRALLERAVEALERLATAADGATRARHVIEARVAREASVRAGADELERRRARGVARAQGAQQRRRISKARAG